jgi:hypothetical protein
MKLFINATTHALYYVLSNTKKHLIHCILTLLLCTTAIAQNNVGIGTITPNSKAILELKANDKGFIAPRVATLQMNAIGTSATDAAMLVYNTDSACYHFYNGTVWKNLCDKSIDTAVLNKAIKKYLNSNATAIINILKGDTALFNYTTINNAVINILTVDTSITNVAIINNATINILKVDTSITNVAIINNATINILKVDTATINYADVNILKADTGNFNTLNVGGQNIMNTITDSIKSQAWLLKGNAGTNTATNFIGTVDAKDLIIKANNQEAIRIANGTRNVGIGQTLPAEKLDVTGAIKFTGALKPAGLGGNNNDLLTSTGNITAPVWKPLTNIFNTNTTTNINLANIDSATINYANINNAEIDSSKINYADINILKADTGNFNTLNVGGQNIMNTISDSIKSQAWLLKGNAGINPATNFIGTRDNNSLRFRTNNTEKMIIDSVGNVGVGTASPIHKLHVLDGLSASTASTGLASAILSPDGALELFRNATTTPNGKAYIDFKDNASDDLDFRIEQYNPNGNVANQVLAFNSTLSPRTLSMRHDNGFIGVGLNFDLHNSETRLHLVEDNLPTGITNDLIVLDHYHNNNDWTPIIHRTSRGTETTPANLQLGDALGGLFMIGRISGTDAGMSTIVSSYRGNGLNNMSDLFFGTSGVNRVMINETGNVGIGTQTPVVKLHLLDGSQIISTTGVTQANYNVNRSGNWLLTDNIKSFSDNGTRLYDGNSNAYLHLESHGSATIQAYGITALVSGVLGADALQGNGATDILYLQRVGNNVAIGAIAPTERLTVQGNINCNGTVYASDVRFKNNIKDLNNSLLKLTALRGVSYDYNPEFKQARGFDDKHQLGVIAQEVEKLFPELVNTGSDGYKAVDYAKFAPVFIEAIKEQQAQIEILKTQNNSEAFKTMQQKYDADIKALKTQNEAILKLLQERK